MAYAPRPDGLNDLIFDDGTRVASPLPASELEAMGHAPLGTPPAPPSMAMSPEATARLPLGASLSMTDAGGSGPPKTFEQQLQSQFQGGPSMAPPGVTLRTPTKDEQVSDQRRAFEQEEARQAKANASKLVPIGAPSAGSVSSPGYAPQRVTKIKGGDVRAAFTRVPGQEVPADVKADLVNTDAEDLELTADAIAQQREELRQKRELQLLDQRDALDRQEARRSHIDQQLYAKQSVIDQRDRQIERMHPQSAREVFQDRGGFGIMSSAITMMLGGYLQGMQGSSQNSGYNAVRDSIMDEVAAQRAAYEDAKEAGEQARNDYAQAIAIYGTPEAAALDLEMRRLGVAEKMIENRASAISDQEYLQAANQAASELRARRGQVKMQLLELERGKVLQEDWRHVPDQYVTTGGAPKVKKEDGERIVVLPDGSQMFARDATRSRSLQEEVKANADLAHFADRLKALTDTVGKREPTAAERASAETIKGQMMFTYKEASKAGALDKGLIEAMDTYFGKPEDMFRVGDAGRKLDEVRRIANRKINGIIRYDLHADPNYGPSAPMPPRGESDE